MTPKEGCTNLLDLEGAHVPGVTGSVNSMRSSCDCGHIEDDRKTPSTGERTKHLGGTQLPYWRPGSRQVLHSEGNLRSCQKSQTMASVIPKQFYK